MQFWGNVDMSTLPQTGCVVPSMSIRHRNIVIWVTTINVFIVEKSIMPRHYQRATTASAYTTELINTARHEVRVNKKSVSEVSRMLGISRTSLIRYLKTDNESNTLGRNTVFTKEEEKVLCQYILDCSKMFYGLSLQKSRELAYKYAVNLKKNVPSSWTTNSSAGKDWMDGFRKRNPQISLRSPEATSLGRATGFNKTTVEEFFKNLRSIYDTNNLTPDRICGSALLRKRMLIRQVN